MDTRQKIRELLDTMDPASRGVLGEELANINRPAPSSVGLDDITIERLADTTFAARVRQEIQAALRGEI